MKPLVKLRDAAEKIEKGNLDVRLDAKSKDEIGALSYTFNSMAYA
ncbi:MAG: HAMP domain-containing protein [Nitrospirota bacterium]